MAIVHNGTPAPSIQQRNAGDLQTIKKALGAGVPVTIAQRQTDWLKLKQSDPCKIVETVDIIFELQRWRAR